MQKPTLENTINDLWELYDEAKNAGDTNLADGIAAKAFQLLESLPQNEVYLSTKH